MADTFEDWELLTGAEDWEIDSGDEDWESLSPDTETLAMTIGGVDVLSNYLDVVGNTFGISKPLNARWTLRGRIEDPSGITGYRPALLQEVIFESNGYREFGGYITNVSEVDWSVPVGIASLIEASDYSVRFDYIYIDIAFPAGQTLKQVVTALHVAYVAGYGMTLASMTDGPTLEAQVFKNVNLTEAFNHLSTITGWVYKTTVLKVLTWTEPGFLAAPFGFVDGTDDFTIGQASGGLGLYRNRQKVLVGTGTRDVTYDIVGDGTTRVFPLPVASATRPLQLYDPVGLAYINVGLHGVDTLFEWTYRDSDNAIVQLADAPPGTPHSPLGAAVVRSTVGYVGQFPVAVQADNTTEQAARDVWESAPVEVPELFDLAAGQALADALVARYSVFPPPRTVPISYWRQGLEPGHTTSLLSSARSLVSVWLVQEISISIDALRLMYVGQMIEGSNFVEAFRDFWRGLSGGVSGTASGGVIVGGSGGGSGTSNRGYFASLGGRDDVDISDSTWVAVPGYLDWVCLSTGTYRARVQCWTSDAGTSGTPRVYDVTLASAAITGTPTASLTRAEQLLSFDAVAGHRYRLQVLSSNINAGVLALGYIEA